ncbi:MAG: hypothetical protein C0595_09605 [Marinilabiliales bacterium]|nr:MAG: hypothetical protein C0595_09605 [Marinilabiliales bacterium]
MGSHPINLIIRFLLEVTALISAGMWAWNVSHGWPSLILTFALPLILAVIWGIFAVPDDPSRSGKAPIVTPGIIRLIIELSIFAFATWAFFDIELIITGLVFGIVVLVHYLVSYDRVKWLLTK